MCEATPAPALGLCDLPHCTVKKLREQPLKSTSTIPLKKSCTRTCSFGDAAQLLLLVKSKSVISPAEPFPITLGDSLTVVERLLVATARLFTEASSKALGSVEALVEPARLSGRVWMG